MCKGDHVIYNASNACVCGYGYYKDIKNQPVYKVGDLKQIRYVVFECCPLHLSLYSCFYLCLIFLVWRSLSISVRYSVYKFSAVNKPSKL